MTPVRLALDTPSAERSTERHHQTPPGERSAAATPGRLATWPTANVVDGNSVVLPPDAPAC
jgi:hypothetical protein